MPQTATNPNPASAGRDSSMRSRLLARLLGLLLILAVSTFLFILERADSIGPLNRTFLGILLFIGGVALIISILALVQNHLLEPLTHIRAWARRMHEGRHGEPLPSPPHSAFADLAGDLNSLGKQISRAGNGRSTGESDSRKLEEKSLQILYEVVASINTAHGLDDLLTRFLYTLKRITLAQGAAIWIVQDTGQMELTTSSGIDESLLWPENHDVRRCLCERAVTEGKIWIEKNLDKCEKVAGRRFFEKDHIGLVSIPMRYRGRVTGVINLFLDATVIERLDGVRPLLTSIAHHLSVAIEKSHNEEEHRQHLINDERTRIAHELHDSLAQSLASLRFQVRVLDETLHQGDESTTWQQLERIENSLDEANTELRGLIANFRAPVYKRGLIEAVEQIVNQFHNETRIKTFLQKEWQIRTIPQDIEIQILRIIQEALWNIRKHSQAKLVRIMLRGNPEGRCHILIEDDGVGFNKQISGHPGEHIGLSIMRERAARLGGELRVESEPGEGTRVALEIDLPGTDS